MFTVVIPVFNQHEATKRFVQTWFNTAKGEFDILFIDNGSKERLDQQEFIKEWQKIHRIQIVTLAENIGVYPTFQLAFDRNAFDGKGTEYLFFSHNDVEMVEYGWDEKLVKLLKKLDDGWLGVCGMFGAKGIGTPDIYKAPYNFTQLMRWDCYTVPSMVGAGGKAIDGEYERVMVLDGFSLIISCKMVENGLCSGFDHQRYPVHHNYDNDICLDSHFAGYKNYVLDIDCIHHGGVTSTREKWAEKMGTTDFKIHRKAHEIMYEKFRGALPVSVK